MEGVEGERREMSESSHAAHTHAHPKPHAAHRRERAAAGVPPRQPRERAGTQGREGGRTMFELLAASSCCSA